MENFFIEQIKIWPLAARNYEALEGCITRKIGPNNMLLQYNPARAVSTGAKIDTASIKARPCFLCGANRPKEQIIDSRFPGYELLVNPFPIFKRHFTIAAVSHEPQLISGRIGDMYDISRKMEGYAIFYNGPKCGASAPDHQHFQAVPAHCLPFLSTGFPFKTFTVTASHRVEAENSVADILAKIPSGHDAEPPVNILAVANAGSVIFHIIPRRAHRPLRYGTDAGCFMVSPASVDLAGVMITPRREDFDSLTHEDIREILEQVCY